MPVCIANPVSEQAINNAYQIFHEQSLAVEYLIGYEGNAFAFTGDVEADLLSITAVHPMRQDAVQTCLTNAQAGWDVIERLLVEKKLRALEVSGPHVLYALITKINKSEAAQ